MNRKVIRPDGAVSWYLQRPLKNGKQYLYCLHFSAGEYQDRAQAARRIWKARVSIRNSVAEENLRGNGRLWPACEYRAA